MNLSKLSAGIALLSLLTGCAVGNKYDYQQAELSLPVKGTSQISLGVIDNRSYVIDGEKPANFIGLQRGGFGNPFDVSTKSGKSLTEDMTLVLDRSLKQSGYQVNKLFFSSPDSSLVANVIMKDGQQKNIVLTVSEWKTDVYMNITLSYDLLLQILDQQGQELASASMRSNGPENLSGGGVEDQNSRTAASAFETKIGRLFNTPQIVAALSD